MDVCCGNMDKSDTDWLHSIDGVQHNTHVKFGQLENRSLARVA